jgi:hypothetical protein
MFLRRIFSVPVHGPLLARIWKAVTIGLARITDLSINKGHRRYVEINQTEKHSAGRCNCNTCIMRWVKEMGAGQLYL